MLVVEDEPLIGMDIEDAIEELGHEVVGPIAELNEALYLAANEALAFGILDINIYGGHSYPVAEMLLKRGKPVLLLSGYGEQSLPEHLRQEAHLTKPFTAQQLDIEIRKLCAKVANSGELEPPPEIVEA